MNTDTEETTAQVQALADFLECCPMEILYDNWPELEAPGGTYLVLTQEEAEEAAGECIIDLVWAFQPWFIADHAPDGITSDHIDAMRGDSCEGGNDAMVALVEVGSGMESFISDAIGLDGLGHFLAHYDGEENESSCGKFLIFRTN